MLKLLWNKIIQNTTDGFRQQEMLVENSRRHFLFMAFGCLIIIGWQLLFYRNTTELDRNYHLEAATGMFVHEVKAFMYFYYYLGLFPVWTEHKPLLYSKEGAKQIIEKHGDTLLMEYNYSVRYGDFGRFFLFWPVACWKGIPKDLSLIGLHSLIFIVALCAVFIACSSVGHPIFGIVLVVFIGSNPFQLYEIYIHHNVFGWNIVAMMLVLALNVPIISDKRIAYWYQFAAPVLTGILIGLIRQIRSEPTIIIISAIFVYLSNSKSDKRTRLAMLLLLTASFIITSRSFTLFIDYKFHQAKKVVAFAGGHPYPGPFTHHHTFWHPLFCGLGDFDTTYGYKWDDRVAYRYGITIMREHYNFDYTYTRGYYLDQCYERNCKYKMKLEEIALYDEVLKQKILHDITHDPLWFGGIILKRFYRIFTKVTPVRVAIGSFAFDIPFSGWLWLPLIGLLIMVRNWILFKYAVFTLPLSLTSLIVYSGGNTPYYSCYHLVAAAIIWTLIFEAVLPKFHYLIKMKSVDQ